MFCQEFHSFLEPARKSQLTSTSLVFANRSTRVSWWACSPYAGIILKDTWCFSKFFPRARTCLWRCPVVHARAGLSLFIQTPGSKVHLGITGCLCKWVIRHLSEAWLCVSFQKARSIHSSLALHSFLTARQQDVQIRPATKYPKDVFI